MRRDDPLASVPLADLLHPQQTALILVNLQNDYCSPSGAAARAGADLSMVRPLLERIDRLVEAARSNGVLILWLQHTTPRPVEGRMPAWRPHWRTQLEGRCVTGTPGHGFVEPFSPSRSEMIVPTLIPNGFAGTMLDLILDAHGIKACVVAGVETQDAVEATARSAACLNYHPVIVADCVSSTRPDLHDLAFRVMQTQCDMLTSDVLRQIWSAAAARQAAMPRLETAPAFSEQDWLRPDRTALVVVDVQNDFCSPGGDYDVRGLDMTSTRTIVPVVGGLVDSARRAGVMVIWSRGLALPKHLSDSFATRRFISRHHDRPYILPGTWGQDIVSDLRPRADEPVVDKFRPDGFVGTPLHLLLDSNDRETVVLVGVVTQGCVESTAQGAMSHNYQVVCVEDAVATPDASMQRNALDLMRSRYEVIRAARLQEIWDSAAQGSAAAIQPVTGAGQRDAQSDHAD